MRYKCHYCYNHYRYNIFRYRYTIFRYRYTPTVIFENQKGNIWSKREKEREKDENGNVTVRGQKRDEKKIENVKGEKKMNYSTYECYYQHVVFDI